MAQQPPRARTVTTHQPQFSFRSVKIYPDECLGTGSYGAVCKATCDDLPCAAKVLHSALFQFNDPGMPAMTRRFQQECEFMGRVKHPCIVQYLGTVNDPESGRPILLMELMDESLTKFLERSRGPIAYHTQVVISHDIVLALSYLHSNGVIHRDLSSNNVLIVAGARAKVTDFGMSKLVDANPRMTPLTTCPGTMAYMPPEALTDQAQYTDKLDCFSTGVVMVQIITRNFPEPSRAHEMVLDPKYPTGRVIVPVPEVERRKKDIDLIEADHPLRPVALDCLNDFENRRPSAQQLCERLMELKDTPRFTESVQLAEDTVSQQVQDQSQDERRRREEAETRVSELTQQLKVLNQELQSNKEEMKRDKEQLGENEQLLAEFQESLSKRESEIEELKLQLRAIQNSHSESQLSPSEASVQMKQPQDSHIVALKWEGLSKPPFDGSVESTAVSGARTYFSCFSAKVYCYDSSNKKWSTLPQPGRHNTTMVIVNGLLTAVGGYKSGGYTNTLTSLVEEHGKMVWTEIFPPMTAKRDKAAVVCVNHKLVVAGGNNILHKTDSVEVMDTNTKQWSIARDKISVFVPSLHVCGDVLYLQECVLDSAVVYSCPLQVFLESCQPSSATHDTTTTETEMWRRIADVPVRRPTCATLCGQLVSVGGTSDGENVNSVYCYDAAANTWKEVGQVPCAYDKQLYVASIPEDKLIVAGKNGDYSKTFAYMAEAII